MSDQIISEAKSEFSKALAFLKSEFVKLQTGRASAALVENIQIEAYGAHQPLKNMAQINIPEPRTISIKPWDKGVMGAIESSIKNSGMGLNPINNGEMILINLPQLTEERRKELVKIVHKLAEDAKISVRQARQYAHQKFKEMEQSSEITEDDQTALEKRLQTAVDEANKDIEEAAKHKEEEVMKV